MKLTTLCLTDVLSWHKFNYQLIIYTTYLFHEYCANIVKSAHAGLRQATVAVSGKHNSLCHMRYRKKTKSPFGRNGVLELCISECRVLEKCRIIEKVEKVEYAKLCILTDTEFFSVCRTLRNKSKYSALQKYSGIGEMQSFFAPPNGL